MPLFSPRNNSTPAHIISSQPLRYGRNTQYQKTEAGKIVTPETARKVATVFRCANIISDDVAKMPFQSFTSAKRGDIQRIPIDIDLSNIAYRMEVQPNRWMSPSIFMKTSILWMLFYGNAYWWQPPNSNRETFILRSDFTYPTFDLDGNLWYRFWPLQDPIPAAEIVHLMINSEDGIIGRSVLEYASETIGRQLGAYQSANKLHAQGFNAAGIVWLNGEGTKEIREKVRESYTDAVSGSDGIARLAVFDNKISKFEPITMKATDLQFLEMLNYTDIEIANFFNLPMHKLNSGKQSYQSNEQQQLEYLSTALDPILVQIEQATRLKWLAYKEQPHTYFRYERSALFRTDAKTRGEYLNSAVQNMRITPNEARQIEDMPNYNDPAADKLYGQRNMTPIDTISAAGSPKGA